jgi:hypothetical protein
MNVVPGEVFIAATTGRTQFLYTLRERVRGGEILSKEEVEGLIEVTIDALEHVSALQDMRTTLINLAQNITGTASGLAKQAELLEFWGTHLLNKKDQQPPLPTHLLTAAEQQAQRDRERARFTEKYFAFGTRDLALAFQRTMRREWPRSKPKISQVNPRVVIFTWEDDLPKPVVNYAEMYGGEPTEG